MFAFQWNIVKNIGNCHRNIFISPNHSNTMTWCCYHQYIYLYALSNLYSWLILLKHEYLCGISFKEVSMKLEMEVIVFRSFQGDFWRSSSGLEETKTHQRGQPRGRCELWMTSTYPTSIEVAIGIYRQNPSNRIYTRFSLPFTRISVDWIQMKNSISRSRLRI